MSANPVIDKLETPTIEGTVNEGIEHGRLGKTEPLMHDTLIINKLEINSNNDRYESNRTAVLSA